MLKTAPIKCINKNDRNNPYERITHIGGPGWKWTLDFAIAKIEAKEWQFYVERPQGDRVWVIVATSPYGNKYLKTEADGDMPNNLLSLPECD